MKNETLNLSDFLDKSKVQAGLALNENEELKRNNENFFYQVRELQD